MIIEKLVENAYFVFKDLANTFNMLSGWVGILHLKLPAVNDWRRTDETGLAASDIEFLLMKEKSWFPVIVVDMYGYLPSSIQSNPFLLLSQPQSPYKNLRS